MISFMVGIFPHSKDKDLLLNRTVTNMESEINCVFFCHFIYGVMGDYKIHSVLLYHQHSTQSKMKMHDNTDSSIAILRKYQRKNKRLCLLFVFTTILVICFMSLFLHQLSKQHRCSRERIECNSRLASIPAPNKQNTGKYIFDNMSIKYIHVKNVQELLLFKVTNIVVLEINSED